MYTEVTILEDISMLVTNIRGLSILEDCILKILKIKKNDQSTYMNTRWYLGSP